VRKFLVLLLGFLVGLLLVGGFIAYRMGAFNSPDLAREEREAYRIVCLPHQGAYDKISQTIREVKRQLADHEDQLGPPCAVYQDDPEQVAEDELRGLAGFVLRGDVPVRGRLEVRAIPRRLVLVARFKGHPAVAAMKNYPAMHVWMEEHGCEAVGPAVEFYHADEVECEIPIRRSAG